MAGGTYLLFVSKPTGYELAEREGEPPAPGSSVELEGDNGRFTVGKVASSPPPGRRPPVCVPRSRLTQRDVSWGLTPKLAKPAEELSDSSEARSA